MGRAFFNDGGQMVAIDDGTPPGHIDPQKPDAAGARPDLALAEIVLRVGATFREGDPRIVSAAWQYLLGADGFSMRRRAAQLGTTVAAISRRARILAASFGMRLSDPHIRALRRRVALASWARRKRRAASDPPTHVPADGRHASQGCST